jgi:hypothetical protein
MLRRIFVPKREEVTGRWRRLINEDLGSLYFSPNIIKVIRSDERGEARSKSGDIRNVCKILGGKSVGRKPLEREGDIRGCIQKFMD